MADDRTIFDEPHHQSLELLSAQAIAEGDAVTAFKLADRRCRIPPQPEPHSYLLRAEASYRLGAKAAALADVAKALEIAPDNAAANRRMLAWAAGPQQMQAALAIIGQENNFPQMRKAIRVLRDNKRRTFASVRVDADAIEGWAVWDTEAPLEISISGGTADVCERVHADAFHPLGEYGQAASFRVRRPHSKAPQFITLGTAGSVFYSTRATANDRAPKPPPRWPRPPQPGTKQVTVVVPIYGDYDATRVCLEALLAELGASSHRAILVEDATPDPRIAKYLAELRADPRVEVIVNARNLGFVGSVNRALDRIKQGDVVILNSDTIVPRGFIKRLAAAARSAPDIGTVTPLSNNGEFCSFPVPNTANPLATRPDIGRIDAIAAKANANKTVDIPSGIGFCLYITRACLDRAGTLSEDFAPGYLEDVDFCLRAREHGFRNVCAPSVYVGHAGSKSFGHEKRALVVRNLRVLERRFPNHRSECAAFIEADPLRAARQAIEQRAAAVASHPRFLVTAAGVMSAVARQRALDLAPEPVMILEVRHRAGGTAVKITNAAEEMPQALQFDLSCAGEHEALAEFVKCTEPSRIEIVDPAHTPLALIELLLDPKVPHDIFIADAGLLDANDAPALLPAVRCLEPCESGEQRKVPRKAAAKIDRRADRWREITGSAQRIVVPSAAAEAFAMRVLPERAIGRIERTYKRQSPAKRKRRKPTACHLGFVPVRSCGHEQWLMIETVRLLTGMRPDISITVIGTALDDIGLMRGSKAFVTGTVDPEEFKDLVDVLGIGSLFVSATRPIFAHPILSSAFSSRLPVAYFDWSSGASAPEQGNLAIDPRISLDNLIGKLSRWMPAP